MSDVWVWIVVPILMVPQIFVIALTFAPKSFWQGLAERHISTAHFLWGLSHMFGPLSRPGKPPAWEKLR